MIGKSTVKRGKAVIMKIGDAEVEVDPKFRLYLQVSTEPVGCRAGRRLRFRNRASQEAGHWQQTVLAQALAAVERL